MVQVKPESRHALVPTLGVGMPSSTLRVVPISTESRDSVSWLENRRGAPGRLPTRSVGTSAWGQTLAGAKRLRAYQEAKRRDSGRAVSRRELGSASRRVDEFFEQGREHRPSLHVGRL